MSHLEALNLLRMCFGYSSRERLAILVSPERFPEGQSVLAAARTLKAPSLLLALGVPLEEGAVEEPVAAAMRWADVLLFVVNGYETQVMGHHPLRREATARGARIGFLTGRLADMDAGRLTEVWRRARQLAERLEGAEEARLVTPAGTDLRLSLKGRRSMAVVGDLKAPGSWGAVPDYAEATISPVEGSAQGTVVADGMITGYGRLSGLLKLTVKAGRVVDLEGAGADWLSQQLQTDEGAPVVAEMGLGANPFVSEVSGDFEDKKIFGTAHIGIGDNRSFGGSNTSRIHLDVLITGVTLLLDGRQVLP